MITPDTPLLSARRAFDQYVLSEQCVRYILARPHGEYTEADVRAIIGAYFRIGIQAGLDPLLAVAQMRHETACLSSWWSQRPRRNPAGIGVDGRSLNHRPAITVPGEMWSERDGHYYQGLSYPTWANDAVPAHIGRLLAYALRDDQATPAQLALIRSAQRYRRVPGNYRGAAPTLRGLAGRWAVPGTTYPDKIAEIANAIRSL